jgi:hypothetical protein
MHGADFDRLVTELIRNPQPNSVSTDARMDDFPNRLIV